MERYEDELNVVAELTALRPTPGAEFAEELDRRAEAGFPSAPGGRRFDTGALVDRFRFVSWRRMTAPVAATAVLAIVAATAVVAVTENDESATTAMNLVQPTSSDGGGAGGSLPMGGPSSSYEQMEDSAAKLSDEAVLDRRTSAPAIAPFSSATADRKVERAARIVLVAEPAEIRETAAEILTTVDAHDGIVMRSSVRSEEEAGAASASFSLLIPRPQLDSALAELSQIAELSSRVDSAVDVTAPMTDIGRRIADAEARAASLRGELAEAVEPEERELIEWRLQRKSSQIEYLRAQQGELRQRVQYSRVSVQVDSGDTESGQDGSWGVGSALDDAGRLLGIAAGVMIVAAAVLAPILIILALILGTALLWRRRSRERALD